MYLPSLPWLLSSHPLLLVCHYFSCLILCCLCSSKVLYVTGYIFKQLLQLGIFLFSTRSGHIPKYMYRHTHTHQIHTNPHSTLLMHTETHAHAQTCTHTHTNTHTHIHSQTHTHTYTHAHTHKHTHTPLFQSS